MMKQSTQSSLSRRRFLKTTGCGAMSGVSVLSSILNLKLANYAAAANLNPFKQADGDYKTIVCLFMNGGNDSFNLLVPTDKVRYEEYATSRSNLALAKEELLPLDQGEGGDGHSYGLHPDTEELQELFNGLGGDPNKRRLSFISNIGTLVEPITLQQFKSEDSSVRIPRSLGSHEDQTTQWQTSVAQGMDELTGWGGRTADILHGVHNQDSLSMGISLGRKNIFQVGEQVGQFVIGEDGALKFSESSGPPFNAGRHKNTVYKNVLEATYGNMVERTFRNITRSSRVQSEFFQASFDSFDDGSISTEFPVFTGLTANGRFPGHLKTALKTIALREQLGLRRQTLFIGSGGFDTHLDLLFLQARDLREWSQAIFAFQSALEEFGLQDSVITFVASEFGRTLRSNGRGTDHAWGGNTMVLGGPVDGGKVLGTYPNLTIDGPDDIGTGGRILPTTSIDELYAELLQWFGVSDTDLPYVLPNIENFYSIGSGPPIGFLKS